ncbi:MAG TPA: DUF5916 domain-containing protein [Pyrinomonadaceae bacterium]
MKKVFSLLCFTLILTLAPGARAQTPEGQATTTATPLPTAAAPTGATTTPGVPPDAEKFYRGGFPDVLPPDRSEPVSIPKADAAPAIDGNLDDPVWQSAAVLKNFYQTQPGDNTAPSKPTEVLLAYDANNLYVGFRAFDEPGKVRATVAKRDGVTDDDHVRIVLDTYNDQRKAYVLIFNPLGVQQDGILTEGSGEDFSFDLLMQSQGRLTDDGYTVEVAIPFKSLRYEEAVDKVWGLHLFRTIKRFNNEQDSWMPLSRNNSALLNQAGRLKGLSGLATERTLELIPSLTLSERGGRVPTLVPPGVPGGSYTPGPDRFVNQPLSVDPGLTVKLGITSNITLDAAINPDFAQVEADQTVITANQRFPIFFEEKRPFFLEGIDIFQTPLTILHTRAIIDPDYAAKLSGKKGPYTFGFMVASDAAPGNYEGDERLDPANAPFLDRNATIGVVRLKRDIGTESSIGLIATTYNFIQNHNHVGGVDGRLRLNKQTYFTFQAAGTNTRRLFFDPEAGTDVFRTGNGFGYSYNLENNGRHWGYRFSGEGRTRDYRSEVGFFQRPNTNQSDFFVRYESEPNPTGRIISWRVFNSFRPGYDWQGRLQNLSEEVQFAVNMPRESQIGVGASGGYERIFEEEFGPKRTPTRPGTFAGEDDERSSYVRSVYGFASTTPSKKYSLFFLGIYTLGAFDFDFGGGPKFPRVSPGALVDPNAPLDPGSGKLVNVSASVKYQPTTSLLMSLDYTRSRLVRFDTKRVAFDQNIYAFRTTYQFTRFTFARARVDYDSLNANMRGQFLLGWAPNPGTAFYAGYNDDLNRNGYNPFNREFEPGFRRNGRTFFIKMSYLFRRNL